MLLAWVLILRMWVSVISNISRMIPQVNLEIGNVNVRLTGRVNTISSILDIVRLRLFQVVKQLILSSSVNSLASTGHYVIKS